MTSYHPGEIVLVPFPFADLTTTKKRPALVLAAITPGKLSPLLMVTMITSQVETEFIPGDFILARWQKAGLIHPSKVRLAKIVTLEEGIVLGKIGALDKTDWKDVRKEFLKLLSF